MTKQSKKVCTELKQKIINWLASNINVLIFDENTIEIATSQRDSLGEEVYCFVEKKETALKVTDDGRCLFKLDPSASDEELFESCAKLIWDAGFEVNPSTGVIFTEVDSEDLVPKISELARLQVAISYLV